MKILVDLNGTIGTVTIVPGRLARWLGAKSMRGEVERRQNVNERHHQQLYYWIWRTTGRAVEVRIERAIELQEVADLPKASAR